MSGKDIKEIGVILDDTEWYVDATFYPDDADNDLKNPVKSRVCGLKDSMVRQEYDKINSLKGLK